MRLSEAQIRDIAALRDRLQGEAERLREELEMKDLNIVALDAVLKQSSFVRASQYTPEPAPQRDPPPPDAPEPRPEPDAAGPEPGPDGAEPETRRITTKNGDAVAVMHTYPDRIAIVLEDGVRLSESTPPFREFFMSRIIGKMAERDAQEVADGKMEEASAIKCDVKTEDGHIRAIAVANYGTEERAREIASTVKWVLTRMLEHARQ